MEHTIPFLLCLLLFIIVVQGEADPISSGKLEGREKQFQKTDKLDPGKERAALFGNTKILPFFSKFSVGMTGSAGGLPPLLSPLPHGSLSAHKPSIPRCGLKRHFCSYDQEYPLAQVNSIVDSYYNNIHHIYSDLHHVGDHDGLYYNNRTYNNYRDSGHFVCESEVEYVRPGWAKNAHGRWLTVINTDKFPQTIRTETCKFSGNRCEYLPPCYKSRCVQRYTYVKLLCADPYRPSNKPVIDVFEIPSSCSCFVEDFVYYKK